jgi:hypothetical protein
LTDAKREEYYEMIAKDLKEGGKVFGTKVVNLDHPIKLEEWEKYVLMTEKDAAKGKYLMMCN